MQPETEAKQFSRVVVMGGGVAGLLFARVLAPHASEVIVLERDAELGDGSSARKGVPQGQHVHLLLRSGLDAMHQLFPELERALGAIAGGALDLGWDTAWKIDGHFRPRFRSDYRGYALARPALEEAIRRELLPAGNVEIRPGQRVEGLSFRAGALVGVRTEDAVLPADLAIDATGRGTRSTSWLRAADFPEVHEERSLVPLSYTSCVVHPRAPLPGDYRVLLVPPAATRRKRGGLFWPIEGGRYLATIIDYGSERPARDWQTFCERAASVDDPAFLERLACCERVSGPHAYTLTHQTFRHYHRAARLPAGLLVVGDALCSFDPAFGQGMSVAALEALALADLLAQPGMAGDALVRRFYARAARIIEGPWSMNRSDELTTHAGVRRVFRRGLLRYRRAFLRAAAESATLHRLFLRVVNLELRPSALLRPWVALSVAGDVLRRALRRSAHARPSPAPLPAIPDTRLSEASDIPLLSAVADVSTRASSRANRTRR